MRQTSVNMRQLLLLVIACVVAAVVAGAVFSLTKAGASSHREAPFIAGDPEADATDVYSFVSPDDPEMVTLLANYTGFQPPAAGPNFFPFGDDVLYEINVDNNGDAREDLTFQFRFETQFTNGDSFLIPNTGPVTSLDDPNLNRRQTYSVSVLEGQADDPQRQGRVIAEDIPVAPSNVGPNSFPEGYRPVAQEAISEIGGGITSFAGPRDDPFFLDLGGTFDLLNLRPLQGLEPEDDFAGLNVNTLALEVPKDMLRGPNDSVIGVYSSSYRQSTNVLRDVGEPGEPFPEVRQTQGPQTQISRLDLPLINELIIPVKDQDRWNASDPIDDAQFLDDVQDPEPASILNQSFGLDVPATPREDLVTLFLTGIPDLNQPEDVTPASLLRLNMDIPPAEDPSRLGVLGGDDAGFPNGRRPIDDVVDIELRALAGATPFTPEFNVESNQLSDGNLANDVEFLDTFPFLNAPHDYAGATYSGAGSGVVGGMPDTGGVPFTGELPDNAEEPQASDKPGTDGESASDGGVLQSALRKITGIFSN